MSINNGHILTSRKKKRTVYYSVKNKKVFALSDVTILGWVIPKNFLIKSLGVNFLIIICDKSMRTRALNMDYSKRQEL